MLRVGLIGRSNVGKSSLFNALLGVQRSIVFDEAGTTRDCISHDARWSGKMIRLIDGRGIFEEEGHRIVHRISACSDCCLFVVDASAGPVPFDHDIAVVLRHVRKPVLVVANKSDRSVIESQFDFFELGFPDVACVSATERRNLSVIRDWCVKQSRLLEAGEIADPGPPADPVVLSVALVGRPNTGKSTLMNRLCDGNVSEVSPTPLTTRDPVTEEIITRRGKVRLIDTAGIRRPSSRKGEIEVLSVKATQRWIRRTDASMLLIASHEAVTDQDMRLLSLLEKEGKPAVILLNFWDRLTRRERDEFVKSSEFVEILRRFKALPISGKTGFQVDRCLPLIMDIYRKSTERIRTSRLNRIIHSMVTKNPPPLVGNRPFNILYASQVSVYPPTFVFFVNKRGIPDSYRRYIKNYLRESLGLGGQPVRVLLRSDTNHMA